MTQLTFLSEGHPAKTSPLQDLEGELLAIEATSHLSLYGWLKEKSHAGFFGKMSPVSCQLTEDGRLEPSSEGWQNAGMGSPTGFLTLNISECHKYAAVCSLSDILETGDLPQRYFLSATACAGILRRAEKRGKTLPVPLRNALLAVVREADQKAQLPDTLFRSTCKPSESTGGGLTASTIKERDYKDATDLVAYGIDEEQNAQEELMGCLKAREHGGGFEGAVAYSLMTAQTGQNGSGISKEIAATLDRASPQAVAYPINTQIAMRHEAMGEGTGLGIGSADDPAFTLQAAHSHAVACFDYTARTLSARHDGSPCADRGPDIVATAMKVRRLTPIECERLQGFPDGYTKISEKTADGNRYKALGNSMAVPVMAWLGQRIDKIERML